MATGMRTPYTEQQDKYLVKYIGRYCPTKENRMGNVLYKTLCAPENRDLWPWAKHHSWQSWRERYKSKQRWFDYEILRWQRKKAIDPSQPSQQSPPSAASSPSQKISKGKRAANEEVDEKARKKRKVDQPSQSDQREGTNDTDFLNVAEVIDSVPSQIERQFTSKASQSKKPGNLPQKPATSSSGDEASVHDHEDDENEVDELLTPAKHSLELDDEVEEVVTPPQKAVAREETSAQRRRREKREREAETFFATPPASHPSANPAGPSTSPTQPQHQPPTPTSSPRRPVSESPRHREPPLIVENAFRKGFTLHRQDATEQGTQRMQRRPTGVDEDDLARSVELAKARAKEKEVEDDWPPRRGKSKGKAKAVQPDEVEMDHHPFSQPTQVQNPFSPDDVEMEDTMEHHPFSQPVQAAQPQAPQPDAGRTKLSLNERKKVLQELGVAPSLPASSSTSAPAPPKPTNTSQQSDASPVPAIVFPPSDIVDDPFESPIKPAPAPTSTSAVLAPPAPPPPPVFDARDRRKTFAGFSDVLPLNSRRRDDIPRVDLLAMSTGRVPRDAWLFLPPSAPPVLGAGPRHHRQGAKHMRTSSHGSAASLPSSSRGSSISALSRRNRENGSVSSSGRTQTSRQAEEQLALKLGYEEMLRRMAANHGFSYQVASNIWNSAGKSIEKTDKVLLVMRKSAEEAVKGMIESGESEEEEANGDNGDEEGEQTWKQQSSHHRRTASLGNDPSFNPRAPQSSPNPFTSTANGKDHRTRTSTSSKLDIVRSIPPHIEQELAKYSPPKPSHAAEFLRLSGRGREDDAIRRVSRRWSGRHSGGSYRDPLEVSPSKSDVPLSSGVEDGPPTPTPQPPPPAATTTSKKNTVVAWSDAEDAILRAGDPAELAALEKRMGKGAVRRRVAHLTAAGAL